jgi:hypothetical protein
MLVENKPTKGVEVDAAFEDPFGFFTPESLKGSPSCKQE